MADRKGYAGKILRVNLSTGELKAVPTENYADRFLGGRGIAAKVHWDEVSPEIGAFDPENRLCIMTGPLCGVPGFAASRWQVSGKSPLHNTFSYCNLGGAWGAQLKFAGYDGLIIHGKSDRLSYLLIDDGKVELKDASDLKGKGAIQTRESRNTANHCAYWPWARPEKTWSALPLSWQTRIPVAPAGWARLWARRI